MFSRNIKFNIPFTDYWWIACFQSSVHKKDDDDHDHDNDQELITSLILNLAKTGNNSSFAWRDIDGPNWKSSGH
ncbi:MAG: hypothetical protein R2769_11420 [Saprospiraceae bacterium]